MRCSKCGKEIPDYCVFCPFCAAPQKVNSDYDDIQGAIGANVNKIKNDSMVDREMKRNAPSIDRNTPQRANNRNNNSYNNSYNNGYNNGPSRRSSGDAYYDDYRARKSNARYEDWGLEPKKKSCKGAVITTIIIFIIVVLACAAITYFGLKPQERWNSENTTTVTVETKSGDETTATKEATTKKTTTEEAVEIDADSAVNAVKSALIEQNSIDENGQTSDGGQVELYSTETTDIDGTTYFVVQADYYDANGSLWETTYYGVSDKDGNVEYLNLNDDGSYDTVA